MSSHQPDFGPDGNTYSEHPTRTDSLGAEAAPDRLQQLLAAIRAPTEELTVSGRTQRMVELAASLAQARYAALALLDASGAVGKMLFSTTEPSQLATLQSVLARHRAGAHALSTARVEQNEEPRPTAPGRPPPEADLMTLPVETRLSHYGTLYVVDPIAGGPFSAEDHDLLQHFAESTALGVDDRLQTEGSRKRQHWLAASAEISRRLLSPAVDELLAWQDIANHVKYLANARTVTISVISEDDPDLLFVPTAAGVGARALSGRSYQRAGSAAALALDTGAERTFTEEEHPTIHSQVEPEIPVKHVMVLPLSGQGNPRGVIVVSRQVGQPAFSATDVLMAKDFAVQAALALELAETRAAQQILEARDDHDRLSATLQDQVLQRLFSIGMSLQTTSAHDTNEVGQQRLARVMVDINETIEQVRGSIDPARGTRGSRAGTWLRSAIERVVADLEPTLGLRPTISLSPALDVTPGVVQATAGIEAALRATLTDIAAHGRASTVTVGVQAEIGGITMTVVDDGVGLSGRGVGLSQLWDLSAQFDTVLNLQQLSPSGLKLQWLVPASA